MKKMLMGVLVLLVAFFCGCSIEVEEKEKSSSAKDEAEIVSDILSNDVYYQKYGIVIEDIEITKRQTNEEDKTDYVWISTLGKASEFRYYADYVMVYALYNDGWMLEYYDKNNSEYEAIQLPSNDIAESSVKNTYEIYNFISTEVKNPNYVVYNYTVSEGISEILTIERNIKVSVGFSPSDGWQASDIVVESENAQWDVTGVWEYRDEEVTVRLEIIDYDADNELLTVNYEWMSPNASMNSNGTKVWEMGFSRSTPLLKGTKYVPREEDGTKDGNKETDMRMAGEISEFGYGEGTGVWMAFYDGESWYDYWLTRS